MLLLAQSKGQVQPPGSNARIAPACADQLGKPRIAGGGVWGRLADGMEAGVNPC